MRESVNDFPLSFLTAFVQEEEEMPDFIVLVDPLQPFRHD